MRIEDPTNDAPLEQGPPGLEIKQQRLRLARLLRSACDGLEARLNPESNDPLKLTMADYLKLLQFAREIEKEIDEEAPKEIQVTWVDPVLKSSK
jgi:hypothetical protein